MRRRCPPRCSQWVTLFMVVSFRLVVLPVSGGTAGPRDGSRRKNFGGPRFAGVLEHWRAGPISTTRPSSTKAMVCATSRAKSSSWVTMSMLRPSRASSAMTVSTSPTRSGSRGTGRFVEEHQNRLER